MMASLDPALAECPDTPRLLSDEEAFAVLEPYFEAIRDRFLSESPKVSRVRLDIDASIHDARRHFAAWDLDLHRIVVAPHMAELPEETVLAIFAHEFGHAVDFLYPATYTVSDGELVTLPSLPDEPGDKRSRQAVAARLRWWKERDDDTIERTADAIGESVLGRRIGYCGPCLLQCFDGIKPRPLGLR
jgi:hypothetical protein